MPRSKPLWFLSVGKTQKCCVCQLSTCLGGSATQYSWSNLQHSALNCNKFPEICLKEFRHVSQQRADILNIFYDSEYNMNYYIWLIINKWSKEHVLTVPAARKHFYQQVMQSFCSKSPMAKSVPNQPVLWTPDILPYLTNVWKMKIPVFWGVTV
jgi:hypothetical protein